MKYWHKRGLIDLSYDKDTERYSQTFIPNDGSDVMFMSDFISTKYNGSWSNCQPNSRYDGICSVTNTSAIGIILSRDTEEAVIQAFG